MATGRAVSDKFLTDKTLRQLKRFLQAGELCRCAENPSGLRTTNLLPQVTSDLVQHEKFGRVLEAGMAS